MTTQSAGPTHTSSCLAPGCGNARAHDGLCLPHLWEAEHHGRYLGGPHTTRVRGCPSCDARPTPNVNRGYDKSRTVLASHAHLEHGWSDGSSADMRDDVLDTTSRLLDDLEAASMATGRTTELGPPGVTLEEDGCVTLTWHRPGHGLLSATIGDPELDTILTVLNDQPHAAAITHDPWDETAYTLLPALERFAGREPRT